MPGMIIAMLKPESFHAIAINGFQTNAFKWMKKKEVSDKLHFGHCMRSSIFPLRRLWHKLCCSFAMWVHYAGIRNGITNYNSIECVLYVLCNTKILPCNFHYVVVIATVDRRPSRASTTIILIIKTYFIWHILSSSRIIYDASYKNIYENDCTCENIAWQSFSFWLRQPMFWMLFRNCFCLLWLCKESCRFTLKIDHQKPYEFTRFAALDGWCWVC